MNAAHPQCVAVCRKERIVAYYREFRISHIQLESGQWVYHILDPGYRKVKTVLSLHAAQMWIDETMEPK